MITFALVVIAFTIGFVVGRPVGAREEAARWRERDELLYNGRRHDP